MELLVNIDGVYSPLQLHPDAEVQLTFDNDIFSFIKKNKTRTTELKIPATASNMSLLGYPNSVLSDGKYMRDSIAAMMIMDSLVISGELSIASVTSNEVSAAFTFTSNDRYTDFLIKYGDRQIADFIKDRVRGEVVLSIENVAADAVIPQDETLKLCRYYSDITEMNMPELTEMDAVVDMLPTANLSYIIKYAFEELGYTVDDAVLRMLGEFGLKLNSANVNMTTVDGVVATGMEMSGDEVAADGRGGIFNTIDNVNFCTNMPSGVVCSEQVAYVAKTEFNLSTTSIDKGTLSGNYYPVVIYDDNRGKGWRCVMLEVGAFALTLKKGTAWRVGFAERVEIQNPDFHFDEFVWDETFGMSAYGNERIELMMTSADGVDANNIYGKTYSYKNNIPEWTYKDIVAVMCYLSGGKLPNITDGGTFELLSWSFNDMHAMSIDGRVLSDITVSRSIPRLSTINVINDSSDDYVDAASRVSFSYNYYNVLDDGDEKVMLTAPIDLGIYDRNLNAVVINDFSKKTMNGGQSIEYKFKNIKYPTVVCNDPNNSNYAHLSHIATMGIKNDIYLQKLISKSTTIEVDVKMYAYEFAKIYERSLFEMNGDRFIVLSANWGGNVANLTLLMLPPPEITPPPTPLKGMFTDEFDDLFQ